MKRILIVNVNWIGDTLFSTPFIRAVRERNPDAYIACLLHPRCKEMLELNPSINEIIFYDEEGLHRSIPGKLRLIAELKKKHFDTAYLLHRSFTKALITYLSGIRERVGYPSKRRSVLLTKIVAEPPPDTHKVEYFLNIARAAGMEPGSSSYEFFLSAADRVSLNSLLRREGIGDGDSIIVICPGGNWGPKRWPPENFAAVADILSEKSGAKIIISGAGKDVELARNIRSMMKAPAVITAGKTTLKELGAIFARAALVIANDSGPMHLAVSMKAPTIALFGPTSPELTGPRGSGRYKVILKNSRCAVPCYDRSCRVNRCMSDIKVEDVVQEALKMLGGK